jgi:hypothetical protein
MHNLLQLSDQDQGGHFAAPRSDNFVTIGFGTDQDEAIEDFEQ